MTTHDHQVTCTTVTTEPSHYIAWTMAMLSTISSTEAAMPQRSRQASVAHPMPFKRLKDILQFIVPDAILETTRDLPTTQLSRLYALNLSNDRKLLLSLAPSQSVKLLRHEATILSSEAMLIEFLTRPTQGGSSRVPASISRLIPKLLRHSANNKELAYPYSIFDPLGGVPVSTISTYLSLPERHSIDKQLGSMARALASIRSPSGCFGPAIRVLGDNQSMESSTSFSNSSPQKTWADAFHFIFEAILRDGEDMVVLLPYEVVRGHFQRLSPCLNAIRTSRLVILDAGKETNIMVQRGAEGNDAPGESVRLTGLQSWGQGVFGDPLLSSCFDNPTESFLQGWAEGGEDIIEGKDTQPIRMLLYRCYRAIIDIVTEYYRPQSDSSKRELEARRRLTQVLGELEEMKS